MGNPPAKPQGGHAGKKRAHPGSPHFDAANEGPESDGKDGSAAPPRRTRIKTIRMQNFLPFEDCSFSPGPQLNLVVGPNGSGKSSTVAAIALGLSDKAGVKVMKRGDLRMYIRKDQPSAEVEILLETPDGTLLSIRRVIHRDRPDGKESQFYLDGRAVKGGDIDRLAAGLDIFIANSCHFLPQEMVHQFSMSASNPQKLLELFITASGGAEMLALLRDLIEHSGNLKNALGKISTYMASQVDLEKRRDGLEEDARKNEKATALMWEVDRRVAIRPHTVRAHAKRTLNMHLVELDAREKPFRAAAAEYNAVLKEKTGLEREVEAAEKEGRVNAGEAKDLETSLIGSPSMESKMERQEEQFGDLEGEEERLCDAVATCGAEVREQEKAIITLRQDANVSRAIDPHIDSKIAAASAARRERHTASDAASKSATSLSLRLPAVREERVAAERLVEAAADGRRLRVDHLRGKDRRLYDQYEAVQDMQKNGLFQKHVFGPLCLEVEVQGADPKLAVYVDAMLGKDGSAFLVLCQHDQDVITNSKNAAVKSINMFNFDKRRPAGGPAPVRPSKQVLEHYGIQGYLIDFVHAPEQVMEFLRNGSGLDKVPIGTETSFNLREEMAHDARLKTTNHDNKFSNTLAGNWIFTPARRFIITYSFYGDKHPIFSDKAYFYQDRCKVALGRPAAEIQNLRDILDKKTAEEQTLSERVPPLQEEARRLRALFDESQAVWKALTDEKHQGKVLEEKIKRCEVKIAQAKKEAERITRTEVPRIAVKRKKLLGERTALAAQAAGMLERLLGKYLQGAAADMNAFPLQKQLGDVKETLREVTRRVTPLKQEYEEMVSVVEAAKKAYDEACEALKGNEASAEIQATFPSKVDASKVDIPKNLDELDQEIDHYKGELDDLGHVSDVTHDLISVATQLAEVNTKLRECEDIKAKGSKEVEAKKRAWLDGADGKIGLRQLVKEASREFSDFFSRMRNVGEVRLHEHQDAAGEDDFEKYGLQILVKFRQETELAALNGKQQSGGECSVSTMCFILALHKLSNVPLRVVDEINQGMDAAYEKAVFEFIVELNCREDAPQCFLITPKLQADILKGVETTGHISVMQVLKGPGLGACEGGHL